MMGQGDPRDVDGARRYLQMAADDGLYPAMVALSEIDLMAAPKSRADDASAAASTPTTTTSSTTLTTTTTHASHSPLEV